GDHRTGEQADVLTAVVRALQRRPLGRRERPRRAQQSTRPHGTRPGEREPPEPRAHFWAVFGRVGMGAVAPSPAP
ncbi:MAG: hypothetical protein JWN54_1915, partial [Mycobacterium sp.]|nr:hypothetical protein [Mycobacterium sp.]